MTSNKPCLYCSGPAVSAHVLATSDVGLRALEGRGGQPPPPLFVHYDLPVRKAWMSNQAAYRCSARIHKLHALPVC